MENPVMIFGAGSLGLTALDIFQRNEVVVYGFLDDEKAAAAIKALAELEDAITRSCTP